MPTKTEQRKVDTSNAAINATIKSLKTASKKVRELIQTGIVQCIEHANAYGDATGAARLVDAIPQEMRRAEVVKHFADYSPIRVTSQGRGKPMKASLRKPDDNGYNAFNVEGVKANPWYDRAAIAAADQREMEIFNIEVAEKRVIDIANLFDRKASAKNAVKLDDNGNPVTDDNGDYVRNEVIEEDFRTGARAMSMMLRMVGNDPVEAAEKLGLPTEYITALKGEAKKQTETQDEEILNPAQQAA